MSETTAPLLATRDALARAIHRKHAGGCGFPPQPGLCIEAGRQADALLASGVFRDPATLADVQIRHHATMRPASHDKWWIWNCKICGTSGSATETGCRAEVESHNRMTSAPMTPHIARALAAALTEDPS